MRDFLITLLAVCAFCAFITKCNDMYDHHIRTERSRCYRSLIHSGWMHIEFKSEGHGLEWCADNEDTWRTKVNQRVLDAAAKIDTTLETTTKENPHEYLDSITSPRSYRHGAMS